MQKNCTQCSAEFDVTDDDLKFLEEVSPVLNGKRFPIPKPTLSPISRMQRRLSFRNERFLYHRKCDLTGKQMISSFSVDKPFPVYDNDAWWSDDWDTMEYGVDFDFNRPFFEQFFALRDRVPRLARQQQKPMINSDYCNCASRNKDCYLIFSCNENEDCYYGSWVNQCKDCIDSLNVEHCELCYECVSCRDCYALRYGRDSINCRESFFLRDCHGCSNCFGCSNQVNKQYMVFNKQNTREEYEEFLRQVNVGSHKEMEEAREKIDGILNDHIVKEYHGTNIENSSGDYLRNCKNLLECFECDHCEDMAYCQCIQNAKNCMDYSHWGQGCEQMYECQACGIDNFHLLFCNLCWSGCNELIYCDQCFSSKDSLGCVSLKQKQYCIFNKQYSKEEYEKLASKIIEHMKKTGEWGEFPSSDRSIYAYNETLAHEEVPLAKEEALKKGFLWMDDAGMQQEKYMGPAVALPDTIDEVEDDICEKILTCEATKKPYKIIPQELKFYRKREIPIPRLCPDERHKERLTLRNPRQLWERTCEKCKKEIMTSFAPDRPETIYCEPCYLQTVH